MSAPQALESYLYQLMVVVNHLDSSPVTGHYTVFSRSVSSEQEGQLMCEWWCIDNDIVTPALASQFLTSDATVLVYALQSGPVEVGQQQSPIDSALGSRVKNWIQGPYHTGREPTTV